MKKPLKIPVFKNEDEERKFWDRIDLTEYFESQDLQTVSFPNLKPTSRSISIRLPEAMLLRLKEEANELNVPYQTLIKQYIAEGIRRSAKAA
jgi:predicted DNA binding CopG/RHH family protein